MLRYVFGCDEQTAAVAAGVSLGTAKSRLHRAREMFRRGWETQPTP
jgi:RNA polymerase sigma-70 factor (ECF subfamily)